MGKSTLHQEHPASACQTNVSRETFQTLAPGAQMFHVKQLGRAVTRNSRHLGEKRPGGARILRAPAPHDIRATDLSTGKTRYETSKALGWQFDIVPDLGVDDGISAGRLMFDRAWIDETRCAPFLEAMGQYRREWKDNQGQFGDRPVHDWSSHPADMWRYAAVIEEQMLAARPAPRRGIPKPRGRFEGRGGSGGDLSWTH